MFRIIRVNKPFISESDAEKLSFKAKQMGIAAKTREEYLSASKNLTTESIEDDEDVHLQRAHDALRSRIAKCKREGKDCKALETRLASVAALITKKD